MPVAKKIAWVGGYPAHYVRNLHRRLDEAFPDSVRYFYVSSTPELRQERKYEEGDLPKNHSIFDYGQRMRTISLLKEINKYAPDLVVVAGHYPRPLWITGIYSLLRGVKVCYWCDTNIHDLFLKSFLWRCVKRVLFNIYLKKMEYLLYMGSANREFYIWAVGRSEFNKKRIFFPYPHDHEHFSKMSEGLGPKHDDKRFRIVSVGRLIKEKCYHKILKALSSLPSQIREGVFISIAGDGPERSKLERLAREYKVDGNIEFVGSVKSSKIFKFIQNGEVFILVSDYEPWGIVINEALSLAVPVIAPYWIGSANDLVVSGMTGISMGNNDTSTIAQSIQKAYQDREKLIKLGINGRDRVEAMGFNIKEAIKNFSVLAQNKK